jgi:hypothetical protein
VSHLYEVGLSKVTGAAAGPIVTILPGTPRCEIREIGIFMSATAASAAEVGIGRPAAAGVGAATGSLGQALDANDAAAGTTLVTSFATTQPTFTGVPFRRIVLPVIVGAGIVWVWGQGEFICSSALAGQALVWQFSALAATYDTYVKFVE